MCHVKVNQRNLSGTVKTDQTAISLLIMNQILITKPHPPQAVSKLPNFKGECLLALIVIILCSNIIIDPKLVDQLYFHHPCCVF